MKDRLFANYKARKPDSEHGLYNYRARLYDSDLARFYATDPLGMREPGITPYHYVYNSPLNFTDPTGMAGGTGQAPDDLMPRPLAGQQSNSYMYRGENSYYIDGILVDYWTYSQYAGHYGQMIDDVKITGNPGVVSGYWEEVPWQKSRDITHPVWGEGIEVTAGYRWQWIPYQGLNFGYGGGWGVSDYFTTLVAFKGKQQRIPMGPGDNSSKIDVSSLLPSLGVSYDIYLGDQPRSDLLPQLEATIGTRNTGFGINIWYDPVDQSRHWNIGIHFGVSVPWPAGLYLYNKDKIPSIRY